MPIASAQWQGDSLTVPFDKELVKEAPTAEADGSLEPDEESMLYRHYGMKWASGSSAGGDARRQNAPHAGSSDSAMTRSEEQVQVGTATHEKGRARLRKWVETEHVSRTVPVSHEEVRVVREPINERNIDRATAGPDMTENQHEVILHEERPVVTKETVPKERIRLEKETVTERRPVEADIRKERISFEEDPPANPRNRPATRQR